MSKTKFFGGKLRKILLITFTIVFFIAILNAWQGWFRWPGISLSAFEAVPATTSLVLEWSNWDDLQHQLDGTSGGKSLQRFAGMKKLTKDRTDLQQLLETVDSSAILSQPTLAALQITGLEQVSFLYVLDLSQPQIKACKQLFASNAQAKTVFRNHTIYQVRAKDGQDWVLTSFRNLLLVARLSLLVEDAVDQLKQPWSSLTRQAGFRRVKRQKKSELAAALWINLQQLSATFGKVLKSPWRKYLDRFNEEKEWMILQMEENAGQLVGEGLWSEKEKIAAETLLEWEKVRTELLKIVPDNVAFLAAQQKGEIAETNVVAYQKYIAPWRSGWEAKALVEPYSEADILAGSFVLLHAKDVEYAKHYLDKYGQLTGELSEISYHNFVLRQLMDGHLLEPLGINFSAPYYTVFGEWILFGNSRTAMELWIDRYQLGQNLAQKGDLEQWLGVEVEQGLFYFDQQKIGKLLDYVMRDNLKASFQKLWASISSGKLAVKMKQEGEGRVLRLDYQQDERSEEATRVIWKRSLKEAAIRAPSLVYNPRDNAYRILIQDASYLLYCFDAEGKLHWKRQLRGTILSDFHVLDYRNDDSQNLVFNTAGLLYLVDEKGRDVDAFPKKLQSTATTGVTVVDFEQNRDYAFFVACANGNIYGMSRDGEPLGGWNPRRGMGRLRFPLNHVQEGGKDYFLAINTEQVAFILGKDGELYTKHPAANSDLLPPFYTQQKGKTGWVLSEKNQNLQLLKVNGQSQKLAFRTLAQKRLKDIALLSDKQENWLFCLEDQQVVVRNLVNGAIAKGPGNFPVEAKDLFTLKLGSLEREAIGVYSEKSNSIHLLQASGEAYAGFPLAGTQPFVTCDCFQNNQEQLFVPVDNDLYAYQLVWSNVGHLQ